MWVNRKRFKALEERVDCLSKIIYASANGKCSGLSMREFFEFGDIGSLAGEMRRMLMVFTKYGRPIPITEAFQALLEMNNIELEWQPGTKDKVVVK